MARYIIRGAQPSDHPDVLRVAHYLNSLNMPENSEAIQRVIAHSLRSFSMEEEPTRAEYLFVLEDTVEKRVIGTSMIFGQLGRLEAPYIYFDVRSEEKYSRSLHKHFHHTVLRIGYSYNGPTEIGGIVLLPEYRTVRERLGQFLSYVRFLFIARYRERFRDEVLAELMPPLEADGTSHLWEALGRHFTDLTYTEADKLSKQNKEFIKTLFPDGDVYASLLPKEAQRVIGEVGPQTKGVEKLLERIGFRYCDRIDPFDGGPHFLAETDEISLVADSEVVLLEEIVEQFDDNPQRHRAVFASDYSHQPFWKSIMVPYEHRPLGVAMTRESALALDLREGDQVMFLPVKHGQSKPPRSTKLKIQTKTLI